jgi:hypothetical protein
VLRQPGISWNNPYHRPPPFTIITLIWIFQKLSAVWWKRTKVAAVFRPDAQGQVAEIFDDRQMVLHADAAAYDFLRMIREALDILFPENFCGFGGRPWSSLSPWFWGSMTITLRLRSGSILLRYTQLIVLSIANS